MEERLNSIHDLIRARAAYDNLSTGGVEHFGKVNKEFNFTTGWVLRFLGKNESSPENRTIYSQVASEIWESAHREVGEPNEVVIMRIMQMMVNLVNNPPDFPNK